MEPLIEGLIAGITVSFLIGPIFFALAEITMTKGWRCGLAYVFGVIISDVVLIYAIEKVLNIFPFDDALKFKIGIIGGILLIVFGLSVFLTKANIKQYDVTNVKTLLGAFAKGVTINVFNPFVTVWWITMYSTISINYIALNDKIVFYFAILLMVFLFDLLKMRFAYYLKQKLTVQKLSIVKKGVGICLFIFGLAMIIKVS
ncbi:MAG TPA: LysE family transporter [Chitinophagales bacterium]|nr:LysE family transporter [Chitinophagales bacterium]HMW11982.1 LysE family transporter [Chitinophagales bacterium]HMX60842.1 LysE family transporter [Chitinophagales bacterium]HMY22692.1 LysE family transporter [Chitinophagales bacterium]HMZ33153.1 LysE family transporter [Chitinophagales bacterium]